MPRRQHLSALARELGTEESELYQAILKVRGARRRRRLKVGTQAEIAAKVGVTPVTLNRWLRGVYLPQYGDLERLAEAMERDPAELLMEMQTAHRERTKKIS